MRQKLRYIFILFILGGSLPTLADNIDALLYSLKICKSDTERVSLYNSISGAFYKKYDLENARKYNNLAYRESQRLNYEAGLVKAFIIKGELFSFNESVDSAIIYFNKALNIYINKNSFTGIASCLNLLGNAEEGKGNFNGALKYYYESGKYYEKAHDKEGIATSIHNLALVYDNIGLNDSAVAYNYKAMGLRLTLNVPHQLGASYNNMGCIYLEQNQLDSSIYYFQKALDLHTKINEKAGLAQAVSNLAICYKKKNDLVKAEQYYNEALKIQSEIGDKESLMMTYTNKGILEFDTRKYDKAIATELKALELSSSIKNFENIKFVHFILFNFYLDRKNFEEALSHYYRHVTLKDSLMNIEQVKESTKIQMKYQFEKKTAVQRAEQERKDQLTREEQKRQRTIIFIISIGLLLVVILAAIIYKSLQDNKQKNKIITEQKQEVEKQKKLVEVKNKEVLDSINYAKRLQQGILPPEEELKKTFPESFVFFKPKDIVSGDFYWFLRIKETAKNKDLAVFAAADCTGHGVPGAFMSMLNNTLLNQTAYNPNINSPADALNFLNTELPKNLKAAGKNNEIKDGMDLAFCLLDFNTNQLQFAGANNPCIIIRGKNIIELEPLKQAITATDEYNKKVFSNQTFQLQKNDCLFLYTDGFADQFGGPKGKKFKYKQLNELLVSLSDKSCVEQKQVLETTFTEWKGELEQVDDVLIIGIKI